MATRQYIGARYVPLHRGEWDAQTQYEPLDVVMYTDGNSYTAKCTPPKGTVPTNEQYWALSAQFNQQLATLQNTVNNFDSKLSILDGVIKVSDYSESLSDDIIFDMLIEEAKKPNIFCIYIDRPITLTRTHVIEFDEVDDTAFEIVGKYHAYEYQRNLVTYYTPDIKATGDGYSLISTRGRYPSITFKNIYAGVEPVATDKWNICSNKINFCEGAGYNIKVYNCAFSYFNNCFMAETKINDFWFFETVEFYTVQGYILNVSGADNCYFNDIKIGYSSELQDYLFGFNSGRGVYFGTVTYGASITSADGKPDNEDRYFIKCANTSLTVSNFISENCPRTLLYTSGNCAINCGNITFRFMFPRFCDTSNPDTCFINVSNVYASAVTGWTDKSVFKGVINISGVCELSSEITSKGSTSIITAGESNINFNVIEARLTIDSADSARIISLNSTTRWFDVNIEDSTIHFTNFKLGYYSGFDAVSNDIISSTSTPGSGFSVKVSDISTPKAFRIRIYYIPVKNID